MSDHQTTPELRRFERLMWMSFVVAWTMTLVYALSKYDAAHFMLTLAPLAYFAFRGAAR